jgi:hypothetical protein
MATRVRYGPLEPQGPRPVRTITWPQYIGFLILAAVFSILATSSRTGMAAIMFILSGVALFFRIGEYRPVEWVVPLARWARQRVSRRRFYIEGATLPGPLADSVLLAYESDDILGGDQ